jgi:phosphoribosylanthranilate isomerase
MRTRVKICGLTLEADIASAVQAGADAIGFVFYSGSKRYVTPARAAALRKLVPAFVDVVALFVNPDPAEVQAVIEHVGPELLQFHGDESVADCTRYNTRFLRAFRAGAPHLATPEQLSLACHEYADAAGWLFDSYSAGYGGSGHGFDHALLSTVRSDVTSQPIILSGGLNAQNVRSAIQSVRPWAIDVSSGVENAPGIKSAEKISAFMQEVRLADAC